jgi:5-methylcytosine-specific restriction endonuclease McrA
MKKRNMKNAVRCILAAARREGIIPRSGNLPSIYLIADALIDRLGISIEDGKRERLVKLSDHLLDRPVEERPKVDPVTRREKDEFYRSWEWRTVRMVILKKHGHRCQSCGAKPSAGNDVVLTVDHIKPISKHWEIRLDPSNLQVLCDECNMGKGAWDETDYRG